MPESLRTYIRQYLYLWVCRYTQISTNTQTYTNIYKYLLFYCRLLLNLGHISKNLSIFIPKYLKIFEYFFVFTE